MAHVGRDRGQLILVTGLLVAVAIVALVLLLNTAIYTENLASRGSDQSGREAVEYRATVIDAVGGLIDAENVRPHATQTAIDENVSDGIGTIDDYTGRNYATGGTAVRINDTTLHPGKIVIQNDSTRQFLDKDGGDGGASGWTMATSVEDVRQYNMTVEDDDLVLTNDTDALVDGAFHLKLVDSGSNEWNVFVYENDSTNELAVATSNGGVPVEQCTVGSGQTEIHVNLTAGTVGGDPCSGLDWASGVSTPFDIEYRNGQNASGTYRVTVNTTGAASVDAGNVNDGPGTTDSPFFFRAVYDATFDVHYETPTLTYRSQVRVAPGEPA